MASPNWDILNIQHSRNIGDKVAAATTDGVVWTSAQRDNHLNMASRRWLASVVAKAFLNEAQGIRADNQWSALSGYITEAGHALTSNACAFTSWTPNVWIVLSAYNSTTSNPVLPLRNQAERYMGSTGGLNALAPGTAYQQYVIANGGITVLGSGATDTITLRYIAAHTALSANGSTDILISAPYWGQILDLAYAIAKEDEPTKDSELAQIKNTRATAEINL